ncbi:hypothetical protein K457DRAFT_23957 [Linnemannia elongata AG-77]|uniref:Uncharacterized protein n=1 Tax=Linnemannia elongata AG-77 TaxID=1314771 RepID=A0A197JJD4_9FUNG|nr:hypothetical protein K457DRAFT_23957 [Linnemannia elongata AG-77]
MLCITLLIRLVLLVTLTAQLIHGLVLDSFHTHIDENSKLQQQLHEPHHHQQQTSLTNPPSSASRKDVVLAPAVVEDESPMSVTSEAGVMHLATSPPLRSHRPPISLQPKPQFSYLKDAFPFHKLSVQGHEMERSRDSLNDYDLDKKAMELQEHVWAQNRGKGRIQDVITLNDGEQQQQQSPQVQQGQEQLKRTTEDEEEDDEEENNDGEYFCATEIWDNKEEERRRREQGLPDLNDEVEDYNDEDGWFLMPILKTLMKTMRAQIP